jgi:uncharacterized membrane protein
MPGRRSDIGRLETFCDGVFAIAATLLILNVHAQGVPLSRGLLNAWPSYAAYAVSFVIIGIIWVNHHAAFGQIGRSDRTFVMINVLFLMCVAFIPFPAGLLAEHLGGPGAKAAAVLYGATLTVGGIFANLFWLYAVRWGRLLRPDADPRVIRGITRSHLIGPCTYLAATLVALVSANVAALLYAAIAAFYVLESSRFGGRAESRS